MSSQELRDLDDGIEKQLFDEFEGYEITSVVVPPENPNDPNDHGEKSLTVEREGVGSLTMERTPGAIMVTVPMDQVKAHLSEFESDRYRQLRLGSLLAKVFVSGESIFFKLLVSHGIDFSMRIIRAILELNLEYN